MGKKKKVASKKKQQKQVQVIGKKGKK